MMNSKCIFDLYLGYKVDPGYIVANPLNLVAFTIKITNYNRSMAILSIVTKQFSIFLHVRKL